MRANGFKTFIVSGGGAEFVRVFTGQVYGVPPEQVVGSTIRTKYELHVGKFDKGLAEAAKRGRFVASIKDDWKTVFPERRK